MFRDDSFLEMKTWRSCSSLSKGQCRNFNSERYESRTSIKTQTTELENVRNSSPVASLVGIKLLFLDEVELEEKEESDDLKLVLKKDLRYFVALALDLVQ